MLRYLTRDGDMIDAIAWAHYGHTAGATEAILAANPDLEARGPKLPAGIEILLPELAPAGVAVRQVRLWD
ncbi:tail protein X [Tistrella mobilis]